MRVDPPEPVNPMDFFPGISQEVDRRITAAEQRIKNWVLVGVLANILTLAGVVIPSVFYLGQISSSAEQAVSSLEQQQIEISRNRIRMNQRIVWQIAAEQWMIEKGFRPPREVQDRD